MSGWKRLHALPHDFGRHGTNPPTMLDALRGMPDTPRQAYMRARSFERFKRRQDAYLSTEPMFKGEIGTYNGFTIIKSKQEERPMAEKTLQPHQQRVMEEKRELDERIRKLTAFLASPQFEALDMGEQLRLVRQSSHMQRYASVLGERIEAWQ